MKKIIIVILFLTCHNLANSQYYGDGFFDNVLSEKVRTEKINFKNLEVTERYLYKTKTTPEDYGAIGDFKRITNISVKQNSNIVYCQNAFQLEDEGKIISIFNSRIDVNYNSSRRIATTCKILYFIDKDNVQVDSTFKANYIGLNGYFGTNNFDAIQNMFSFDKKKVYDFSNLIYGISRKYATNQKVGASGIQTNGGCQIIGNNATIKLMDEQIQQVDLSKIVRTNGLNIYGDGNYVIDGLRLENADSITTEMVYNCEGVFVETRANKLINLTIKNSTIKGFGGGYLSHRGGNLSTYITTNFINDSIIGQHTPISEFSQDGAFKKVHVDNCIINGGGAKAIDTVTGFVSMTAGSNVITITKQGFTFYDYYTGSQLRNWQVKVNGVSMGAITSILSPTQAILTNTATTSITSGTMIVNYATDGSFGHIFYIHPNVSLEVKNTEFFNGFDLNYFSGGGVPGIPQYCRFINCQRVSKYVIYINFDGINLYQKPIKDGGYFHFENCPGFKTTQGLTKVKWIGEYGQECSFGDSTEIRYMKLTNGIKIINFNGIGLINIFNSRIGGIILKTATNLNINNSTIEEPINGFLIENFNKINITNCNLSRLTYNILETNILAGKKISVNNSHIGTNQNINERQLKTYTPAKLNLFNSLVIKQFTSLD